MRAVVRRLADRFQAFDEAFTRRAIQRPGRSRRLIALSIFLFSLYALTGTYHWHDGLVAVSICVWAALYAIAPRSLYDGRAQAWSEKHTVLSWLTTVVFLAAAAFPAVSALGDDWPFALTVLGGAVCLMVARSLGSRIKQRRTSA
ncbi:hypothetical protein [Kribbella sp. NPDC051137]|uniref:hypothetical protein n=1 Tax=Kribbella sp. NPDC051137 TaxID=3155045 RepID=UPI002F8A0273